MQYSQIQQLCNVVCCYCVKYTLKLITHFDFRHYMDLRKRKISLLVASIHIFFVLKFHNYCVPFSKISSGFSRTMAFLQDFPGLEILKF